MEKNEKSKLAIEAEEIKAFIEDFESLDEKSKLIAIGMIQGVRAANVIKLRSK